MMVRLGIDPGLSGAIACIAEDGEALVYDIPVIALARSGKRKRDYDIGGIVRILRSVCSEARSPLAVIELVHAMPTNGSIGNFCLGRGTGIIEGVISALTIPYVRISPQAWKKRFGLLHTDKEASRAEAIRRFPNLDLSLKKHDGRAEALLLALYGRLTELPIESDAAESTSGRTQERPQ